MLTASIALVRVGAASAAIGVACVVLLLPGTGSLISGSAVTVALFVRVVPALLTGIESVTKLKTLLPPLTMLAVVVQPMP